MDITEIRQILVDQYGSGAAAAREMGISRRAFWKWEHLPPGRALQVSRMTGLPVESLLHESSPSSTVIESS